MCVKIREIRFLYCHSVIMNKNFNKSTCAVCFEVKGEHSKTLNKITKGLNICVDFELRDSKQN